jgi:insulysin
MSDIIKSKNDHRLYKYIRLKNRLDVLLINDNNTKMSCASLTVGVGSFDEPIPGLAHFLEHMLFLGSEKYPKEDEYSTMISNNGGYSNAYTTDEHTNYYFSTQNDGFYECLDIFAHFFISPLFTESSVMREINAVNSEHEKNISNDLWRQQYIISTTCNKDIPLANFTTGNTETLNRKDIRKQVMDFYDKYYSAHLMKLVVISPLSLKEMEDKIIEIFSKVKLNVFNPVRKYTNIPLKTPSYLEIIPVKKEDILILTWQVPYKNIGLWNPYYVLLHILGHEGKNTLVDYLKNKGYIKDLYCEIGSIVGDYVLLTLKIKVLELNKLQLIYNCIYSYINTLFDTLKTNKKEYINLYKDICDINKINFDTIQYGDLLDYVSTLGANWSKYKLKYKNLLCFSNMFEEYNDSHVNELLTILKHMTNDNSVTILSSHSIDKHTEVDKWYKIKYNKYIGKKIDYENNIKLSLPASNPFIIKDYNILDKSKYISLNSNKPLSFIKGGFKIYWKFDTVFKIPKTRIITYIRIPDILNNAKSFTTLQLYLMCFKHQLNPYLYEMILASYDIHFNIVHNVIKLSIYGYVDKIYDVLKFIIDNITKINILEKYYLINKEKFKLILNNTKYDMLYELLNDLHNKNVYNIYYDHHDMLKEIDNIRFEDLQNIKNLFYKISSITTYVHGNIDIDKVNNIYHKLKKLSPKIDDINMIKIKNNIIKRIKSENKEETNNIVGLYYPIGYSIPNKNTHEWKNIRLLINLIDLIIYKSFYHELRTTQQLGYIVKAFPYIIGTDESPYYYYIFIIQSNHKSSKYLEDKIREFINKFNIDDSLSEDKFNKFKLSVKHILEDPDKTLYDASEKYFKSVINPNNVYDIENLLISHLDTINRDDLINFYKKYILNGTPNIVSIDSK